ncbi:inositol monophosphatase family protein [Lentzea sp. HUAS12]|uniref:inositol monophosphatase family protein n=1 Tax=Lentzea sp. HUAS12 TaxID=2951806 RepID=UPI0020A21064|nr:inositol monophosphatase family protein [Lentzea sp. HUAS12]USX56323.1 hypothetical protein ND450_20140 [Lentzea sp. HUAS12]
MTRGRYGSTCHRTRSLGETTATCPCRISVVPSPSACRPPGPTPRHAGASPPGNAECARSSGRSVDRVDVDPIDGTTNLARGIAFFCTSVGAVVHGMTVDPIARHVFTADLDNAELTGEPIRSTGVMMESRGLLITGYPNARDTRTDGPDGLAHFGELVAGYSNLHRPGSAALSMAHVAAGWADAALGTLVSGWDVCAAWLLLIPAGDHYHPFGGTG